MGKINIKREYINLLRDKEKYISAQPGPTNFASMIRRIIDIASKSDKYLVLVMMTDGQINNMENICMFLLIFGLIRIIVGFNGDKN